MENIGHLENAGYHLEDAVQSNVYLSSMNSFHEFNRENAEFFNDELPAR